MNNSAPHFLLFSETRTRNHQGEWKIALQAADGSATFEITDREPEIQGERLELLSVIRGLESLSQPSRVTLVTTSRYVARGIAYGLDEWRRTDWTWERFGEMAPVKNADLWRRLDRAMGIHQVENRNWRFDAPQEIRPRGPHFLNRASAVSAFPPTTASAPKQRLRLLDRAREWIRDRWEDVRLRAAQFGTRLLPCPWLG